MRIAGSSYTSYFTNSLYAAANVGSSQAFGNSSISSLLPGSSNSSSTGGLDYAAIFGSSSNSNSNVSSTPSLGDILTTSYQFSNTIKTSAMSNQLSIKGIDKSASDAASEMSKNGKLSDGTLKELYSSVSTFAASYNSTVNSLYYAPSYSNYVQSIEKNMKGAVSNNMSNLQKLGFSVDGDTGKLSLDEEKFKKAVGENPNVLKDLFASNSSFATSLSRANDQAADSRTINKSEISTAVRANYQTYRYGNYVDNSLTNILFNQFG